MKNSLLILSLAALSLAAIADAAVVTNPAAKKTLKESKEMTLRSFKTPQNSTNALRKAPAKKAVGEEVTFNWGYCYDPYNAFYLQPGPLKGAMMLTAEDATAFAGAKLSAIQIANPTTNEYSNPIKEATVWLSESLDAEPFLSATGELGSEGFEWSSIELPEAYTIQANTPVYIGYTMTVPYPEEVGLTPDDYIFPIIVDYAWPENDCSAYVYSHMTSMDMEGNAEYGDECTWLSLGEQVGNLCITATLTGDMFPENLMSVEDVLFPSVVGFDMPFNVTIAAYNLAVNDIFNYEVSLEIADQGIQTVEYTPEQKIGYKGSDIATLSFRCLTEGREVPYQIYVSKVNGVDVEDPQIFEGTLTCLTEGYSRHFVVEEGTGTWCGYCVYGITGMEYMRDKYGDEGFIGIAVHGDDEMDVMGDGQAYQFLGDFYYGFPEAFGNRDVYASLYPTPEELEDAYLTQINIPAFAQINAAMTVDPENERKVTLHTKTNFISDDDDSWYGVGFTVIEDNVGPYVQSNYLSGSSEYSYGWEDQNRYVLTYYNDVARNCSQPDGMAYSFPEDVKAGVDYEADLEFELSDVDDLSKYRIVAMVINNYSMAIENACMVTPDSYGSSVNLNEADAAFNVTGEKGRLNIESLHGASVFTANGVRVASNVRSASLQLPAGIYIVTANGHSRKVIVR